MAGKEDPRHRVAVCALIERGGELLCHQRPQGGWGAGKWEFPGGKIDPGESPREALARECREELGVRVRVGAAEDAIAHKYESLGSVILLFFWCAIEEGEPEPACQDGGAVRWASGGGLLELDWLDADIGIVSRLAAAPIQPRIDTPTTP